MRSLCRRTFFALMIAAMPAIAAAEDAFTLQQTAIYAGPSSDFPQIASLPPDTEVGVAGCLSDWSWCDVTFSNDRGWVWAGDLGYPYQNQRVVIIDNGPRLHIPVVTFSLNAYWDAHYRSRPFFGERDVWVSRVHVEGEHGGKPPHGGTRVARPSGDAQSGRMAQGAPQAQSQAQAQSGAQAQGAEAQAGQHPPQQRAQTDQHSREQAQTDAAKSPQRQQPQASQSTQGEPRAQSSDERGSARDTTQQQRERSNTAQNTGRGEAMHPEPDRGANAKGTQNEASRGESDRGASAKGAKGERPKEEGREADRQ
jgi:uncharacterized protein YraI